MKIYKLSLGSDYFDDSQFEEVLSKKLVCLHPNTTSKGRSNQTQAEEFLTAEKGSLFYVCRSNNSVEFIGMFNDKMPLNSQITEHEDWVDRSFTLIAKAINSTNYDKELDKWWTPKNNSTFIEIKESELEIFESAILQPAFQLDLDTIFKRQEGELNKTKKGLKEYKDLQIYFQRLEADEVFLFNEINNISEIDLQKLMYSYDMRGNISGQPVVSLRKEILKCCLENEIINEELIINIKDELSLNYERNVYLAWKSNFRILYTFLFEKYKKDLEEYFSSFIRNIQLDLGIQSITKSHLVHFDGAQNQGDNRIWFAIYNNSHKSQKFAKQLFFTLAPEDKCGLLSRMDSSIDDVESNFNYSYNYVLERLKKFKNEIINDNSMVNKELEKYAEILEYKKQIIFQGPPGTGKTYKAKALANFITGGKLQDKQVELVQFHPSYSYEDFVRGIEVENNNGQIEYRTVNKVFGEIVQRAQENFEKYGKEKEDSEREGKYKKFILIIDEINRANLPSVLGELIYGLEYRGEQVESMYAIGESKKRGITIPENLFIIGTMNTADRSVGHIDYAIRRRFSFINVLPNEEIVTDEIAKKVFREVEKLFIEVKDGSPRNAPFLAPDFDYKDVQIGHSYFLLKENSELSVEEELKLRLDYEIKPILYEYVKDGVLLESAIKEINNLSIG